MHIELREMYDRALLCAAKAKQRSNGIIACEHHIKRLGPRKINHKREAQARTIMDGSFACS